MKNIDNPKIIIENLKSAIDLEENTIINYTRYAKEAENIDSPDIAEVFRKYAIAAEKHTNALKNVLNEQSIQ